ncbi:hypothetical protein [uncultured Chryseobacterium sp.]|uniref:hypothetical protein n=1 Tax=uncultured Chryseobacterium sp. TaxID=259322 RepID=UPI00258625B1|nr:hypothetical protein [uncultured Chryseobacterium sp.]
MKTFLIPLSLLFFSCSFEQKKQQKDIFIKDNTKSKKTNFLISQSRNVENSKSFVISCGSGCAMTYIAENILNNDAASIKVKFKVEMHRKRSG